MTLLPCYFWNSCFNVSDLDTVGKAGNSQYGVAIYLFNGMFAIIISQLAVAVSASFQFRRRRGDMS